MSRPTQDTAHFNISFCTGLSPSMGDLSRSLPNSILKLNAVLQPQQCLNIVGLGCSRFARHYSGNRDFFLFLALLRCFSSRTYLRCTYGFSAGYPRITTGGFPHSEIPGSKTVQRLPGAYRSRPRPSSAPDAKASTVCPYSLTYVFK